MRQPSCVMRISFSKRMPPKSLYVSSMSKFRNSLQCPVAFHSSMRAGMK